MNGNHNSAGGPASEGASMKVNAFVPLTSQYTNSFAPTTTPNSNGMTMTASSFKPSIQPYRPTGHANPLSLIPVSSFDDQSSARRHDAPFSATSSPPSAFPTLSSALVRNLPHDITGVQLRLMLAFSNDLNTVEILPVEASDDQAPRAALLKFRSPGGALEVKNGLDGKKMFSENMPLSVEVVGSTSPTTINGIAPPAAPGGAPTAPSSRQTSRFNGTFQGMDKVTTSHASNGDLSTPIDGRVDYANLFSTQSPIGNHITGNRMTGKTLIDAADDEETDMLLHDPLKYAENGLQQRRQTASQIPIGRMAGLSLNANPTPGQIAHYGHPGMNGFSGLQNSMSPTAMVPNGSYNIQPQRPYPPINPADQHPPCNTLYVGNLPLDTSEEELKQLFCRQRGYKRLCFRTKQNGPMCFVEFEDISFATRALTELYGHELQNSTKGGIRLSFSKNPLGVRSGQTPVQGMPGVPPGGFTTASGPPPGLTPPGLSQNRAAYTNSPGASSNSSFNSPNYTSAQYQSTSSIAFQSPSPNTSNVWGTGSSFMYHPNGISGHTPGFHQQYMMHQRS